MEFQKLTLSHYSDKPEEERRVTLSPGNIIAVAAEMEDTTVANRSLRAVTVMFLDGGSIDLVINHADLESLENAVGAYCIG